MSLLHYLLHSLSICLALAAPLDPVTLAASSAIAMSTACGDIVNSCNNTFTAKQAYDCLISVPFNPAIASNFIKYYNDTLQFHSTTAYLKDPPSSYQQPAVDLLGGLEQIQQAIDQGRFHNQYAFEATLETLVYSAHDDHLQLDAGILAAFNFYSPYDLVSLSADGVQVPKVYVVDDVALAQESNSGFTASAVKTINGQDVTTYLAQLAAANSPGHVEAHADWNDLMSSFANYVQGTTSLLEGFLEFYPGDTMTLGFENGTQLDPEPFYASYLSIGPTGPLSTGGDFFNFFVTGFYPASFDPHAPDPCAAPTTADSATGTATTSVTTSATATSWPNSSYPDTADVFQPNLFPDGGGFLTGYFLKNISTAVLSIPTFAMFGNDTQTFSSTVEVFLDASHAAGIQKILIDLQGNTGGDGLLAIDTFKHFFPSNDTFRGSRLRAHPMADTLGDTFTQYFTTNQSPNSTVYDFLAASPWTATDRLDASSNLNFSSWGAFYGSHEFNNDFFTTIQRENISSSVFDQNALGIDIYAAVAPPTSVQHYGPADIAILTDGLCSSACAVFVEMMHHDAGVRVVAAGGLPQNGPMQAASGSRGAQAYSSVQIDDDVTVAAFFNESTIDLLPNRTEDVLVTYIGVNLRDQIRKGEDVPTQFLYDAADCRIFYTAEAWFDYSKLWAYASKAIWYDSGLCVAGSTGYASNSTSAGKIPPQGSNLGEANAAALHGTTNEFITEFTGLQLDSVVRKTGTAVKASAQTCDSSRKPCPPGYRCVPATKPSSTPISQGGPSRPSYSGMCQSNSPPAGGSNNFVTSKDSVPETHFKRTENARV